MRITLETPDRRGFALKLREKNKTQWWPIKLPFPGSAPVHGALISSSPGKLCANPQKFTQKQVLMNEWNSSPKSTHRSGPQAAEAVTTTAGKEIL